jgi:hypothetical protein
MKCSVDELEALCALMEKYYITNLEIEGISIRRPPVRSDKAPLVGTETELGTEGVLPPSPEDLEFQLHNLGIEV